MDTLADAGRVRDARNEIDHEGALGLAVFELQLLFEIREPTLRRDDAVTLVDRVVDGER